MVDFLFVVVLMVIGFVAQLDVVKQWRYNWAIKIVDLAVAWTYTEIVRPMKKGKLTEDQAQQARLAAVNKAKEIAARRGIDLDQVLGEQLLELFVEISVNKLKK